MKNDLSDKSKQLLQLEQEPSDLNDRLKQNKEEQEKRRILIKHLDNNIGVYMKSLKILSDSDIKSKMAGAINQKFNMSEVTERMQAKVNKEKEFLNEIESFDQQSEEFKQFLKENSDLFQVSESILMENSDLKKIIKED